ncbi:MAG: hypothetical protein H7327_15535 [Herminiimonas sp.]|nr:hypothetical protein [Herminiimonas sp.]
MAATSAYAGYLVIGVIAAYLDTGRFVAALILAVVFARFPHVRQGKLRTIGLLPKAARLPVMVTLLALCMGSYLSRGEMVPVAVLGLAAAIVLTFRWIRLTVVNRVTSMLFRQPGPQADRRRIDPTIIDAEFRETKD